MNAKFLHVFLITFGIAFIVTTASVYFAADNGYVFWIALILDFPVSLVRQIINYDSPTPLILSLSPIQDAALCGLINGLFFGVFSIPVTALYASKCRIIILLTVLIPSTLKAHEQSIHKEITRVALQDSPALTAYLSNLGFSSVSQFYNEVPRISRDWIIFGSDAEDFQSKDPSQGGQRPIQHFYDPLRERGLSILFFGIIDKLMGNPSFEWAAEYNGVAIPCLGFRPPRNYWSWQNGGTYEFDGLTATHSFALAPSI